MNLPHHRRYNWQLLYREYKRAITLFLIVLAVGIMLVIGEYVLLSNVELATAKLSQASLALDRASASNFGAPAYVRTDWVEGTTDLYVRKPK